MKRIFLLMAIVVTTQLHAQVPTIEWQKYLGGSLTDDPIGGLERTSDGGYIMVGTAASNDGDVSVNHGSYDIWITKINHLGALQWEKSIGYTYADGGISVEQTNDSGYIVAGSSQISNLTFDGLVIKLTNQGSIVQKILLGGLGDDEITSIQQTADGGYIFAGYTTSTDGGFSGNHGSSDFWIGKLGIYFIGGVPSLHLIWQKLFGGKSSDIANSILQTPDGGYIVVGMSFSNDGDISGNIGGFDGWIVKLDSVGNLQWEGSLGNYFNDNFNSIKLTSDGGYILCGSLQTIHERDYWIVKLNQNFLLQWEKVYGGSSIDEAMSINETSDGGFIVGGYSYSTDGDISSNHGSADGWVVKLDNQGNLLWQESLGDENRDRVYSIMEASDGGYILGGYSETMDVYGDYWIAKLTSEATFVKEMKNKRNFSVFPNPFTDKIVIKDIPPNTELVITNILGEIVNKQTTQGSPETLDFSKLPIGLYIISIEGKIVKKIMKSKN